MIYNSHKKSSLYMCSMSDASSAPTLKGQRTTTKLNVVLYKIVSYLSTCCVCLLLSQCFLSGSSRLNLLRHVPRFFFLLFSAQIPTPVCPTVRKRSTGRPNKTPLFSSTFQTKFHVETSLHRAPQTGVTTKRNKPHGSVGQIRCPGCFCALFKARCASPELIRISV